MPIVVLKTSTHRRLARVKAEMGVRSFDQVIQALLEKAEKELGIQKSSQGDESGGNTE